MKPKVYVVIPAYNEEKKIKKVVHGLKKEGIKNILVVNDASQDKTASIVSSLKVNLISHPINRGLGGALGTGFEFCRQNDVDVLVTFDADDQHDPKDIPKLIQPILDGKADFVIGSRLIKSEGMPFVRKIGNYGLNIITYFLFGVWTTDSQSGLRAFSKKAIKKIHIRSNRMEVSSEFFYETRRQRLKYKEVPIKPIYSEYSLEKGQSNLNAINIVIKLILKKLMR